MHHKIEIPLLYMNSIYKILLKIKIQKINKNFFYYNKIKNIKK